MGGYSGLSGVFENQGAFVVQVDFLGLPCRTLVKAFGIGIGTIPGPVEPVENGSVVGNAFAEPWRRIMKNKILRRILLEAWPERSVGNPFLDRLSRWFDRFHGLIRPPRWRAHPSGSGFASVQNAYMPSAFFNFLAADDLPDRFHVALAAGTFERIAAPCFQDQVAP